MAGGGIQQGLKALMEDGLVFAALGTVDEIETHPDFGFLLNITLIDERPIQARLIAAGGHSTGGGFWMPVAAGDEVLVIFPEADVNNGLAIAGLASKPRQVPGDFDNTAPVFTHAGGLELRLADGTTVKALVREDFLGDFATWLGAFDVFLAATSIAVAAPAIAAAAAAMIATLTGAFGSSTGFTTNVGGAAAGYRSKATKSE